MDVVVSCLCGLPFGQRDRDRSQACIQRGSVGAYLENSRMQDMILDMYSSMNVINLLS